MASFARLFVALVVISAATLGGMVAGLAAGSPDEQRTSVGTIRTSVKADLDGHVLVYVPIVDWRVRLLDHDAPITITIELRGIDRDSASEGVSSSSAAARSLEAVRADVERAIEETVRRAVLVSAVGGIIGSFVAGSLLAGALLRRRWLVIAPLVGSLGVLAVLVPSLQAVSTLDDQRIEVVAAGGNAHELPVVLRFAEQLLDVGDEYEEHFATALRSLGNVEAFLEDPGARPATSELVLISDLHDNVFVLDALDRFVRADTTVVAAGDFVQVGARIEERTAGRVARLGSRLVAVSGNHDTPQYMSALRDAGAVVLDGRSPTTTVSGLLVAGMPDPLERDGESTGEHRLRVYGEEYDAQRADVIEWWDALPRRPDVVVLHQHGFAHHLVDELQRRGDVERLVVLTGHDHVAHVHANGPHAIVDAGTVGAGGIVAVGEQRASFARLGIARGRIHTVYMVSIEPLTGRANVRRTRL